MADLTNKKQLRRSLLNQRLALSVNEWQQKSAQICQHLAAWPTFQNAHTVLSYFSFRQEPDLRPLYTSTQRWGFPRCDRDQLVWHHWSSFSSDDLETDRFGILSPLSQLPTISAAEVDLILVPAVACDYRGYRLGYGAGFYDRMLSQPEWSTTVTLGIVFQFAHLPHLPTDSWDRPLNGVCSDAGIFEVT